MKISILMDNTPREGLASEWGLAVHIEYDGRSVLLDGGATGQFVENAEKMGIDLSGVDAAVLSHAHYDHADGLAAFFEKNSRAKLYVREGAAEDCYDCSGSEPRYIGIRQGFLDEFADRIEFAEGDYVLPGNIRLIPHKTMGLGRIGRRMSMYRRQDDAFCVDCFVHEQSLVFDTSEGLVILNSCCHGGVENTIWEVAVSWPGKEVYAFVGGMHLFKSSDEEIMEVAEAIRRLGVKKVYTGHCTGERALELLQQELGDIVEPICVGMEITI